MVENAEYRTLGLTQEATWEDVKRAFRRLARTYHPDVAGPSSARKFTEITEAYMTLKELASSSLGKIPSHGSAKTQTDRANEVTESIFKKFWRALFSRGARVKEKETEWDMPPARIRFVGGIISRAESEMYGIMSKRGEYASRAKSEAIIRRMKSKRPDVVLLALRQLSFRNFGDDIASAAIEHFRKNAPCAEVLGSLLEIFSKSRKRDEMARALVSHAKNYSEREAMALLGHFRRWRVSSEFIRPFLSHKSPAVVAAALSGWPDAPAPSERSELTVLLSKDEEVILLPLLRLLKRGKLPQWAGGRISRLMNEHPSPAVRVWASAIVREQNLS